MCKLNFFDKLSAILVLLGAFNSGGIGLFSTNIIASLVGNNVIIFRIIYILILVGAIDLISLLFRCNIFKTINNN
ncbi:MULTISPECIES: DUF378 domain-containing protein [unclassified Clostridium]|uniref:DUF378 domain-containing protein n=1 Tax=Clostridium TaxID=1485 RepID=UPI001C8BE490|nr:MULTISPECIES: DUF378 domain-containing protein [unclassified Clostridium]MBX9136132.1 DUF378 domain-containing protein [Clostridium sp. K12(2020)]MBX9143236.1 DUF378 domain-containing protein [Clostridium sp. K13]MDU2289833.1 DUF378 domain-containing protein [Clostridium celatum]MDU4326473.1 DUF378 domain-containing protein [Clostridium celatum]